MSNFVKLGNLTNIEISGVDKKIKDDEIAVRLCNFTDVYYNWAITQDMLPNLLQATATEKEIKKFSLKSGQVAITKDSETRDDIGMSTYIADTMENVLLGYHCILITSKDKNILEGKYLNALINSQYGRKYFENQASGSGQRYTLANNVVADLKIPLLAIDKQKKIGNIFSYIDRKIQLNNKINAELEAMAKTIYDYWFLQFEFPNAEGKPYKSSGGKMVYNEELKREIPEGWTVKPLSEFGLLTMGQSPHSSSYNENAVGLPLINGATELQKDKIEILKYTTKPTRTCEKDDLIFCIRATIGNLTYADKAYCLGRCVAGFKPGYKRNYGYMFFVIENLLEIYNKILSGSVIVGISKEDLLERRVVKPPASLLENFSHKINPVIKKRKSIRKENQELIALRDFLLPLLMNGQVSFKE